MSNSPELFIRQYALWYVARYSTCSHTLRKAILRRLQKKELFSTELLPHVEKIIKECQEYSYFNDEAFMLQQLQKWQNKGYRYPLIFARLARIGFQKDDIRSTLKKNGISQEKTDTKYVLNLLKSRGLCHEADEHLDPTVYLNKKRRALSLLARRGFSYNEASELLQQVGFPCEP